MVGFTQVFGGGNIYPSEPTYNALNISANIVLQWPIEQAIAGTNVVADIMDVTATVPGLAVSLPDARQVSTGFTALFNNVGASTVSINNSTGGTLVSLVSGTVWQLYLTDNSTAAGTWRVFQFGASVSVAVAAALAGSGLKAIGSTLNERMLVVSHNINYVMVDGDRASVQQWTSGVGQFTLPNPGTVGADWFVVAKNSGSGNLTMATAAGTIDGNATLVLAPGSSAWFVTDGANYFSLSSGASGASGAFNLIVIDVSGSGTFTLSGGQLNQIGYRFTGVLTGNRTIVVPNTTQEYWVDNETTGAFTLSVGTASQISPIIVPQGNKNILYSDGTNVISATSATVTFPIAVVQGGTGATTASGARTNLGSTAVGDAVFTAASQAAAQAALGVPPSSRLINTGTGLTGGGDLSADRTLSLNQLATSGVYTVKAVDTGRASTTAASADPELSSIAIAGAGVYEVEMLLGVLTGAGTGGIKLGLFFSGTSLAASDGVCLGKQTNLLSILNSTTVVINGSMTDDVWMKYLLKATSGGNLSLQWAQNLSDPTATVVQAGSFIKVRQVA